ncbi:MAG: chemotaxis protein CheA [Pseudomonadales bacterium]|nr:chemotaxis protein CheA [Pseudomonadales bacterium]
MNDDDQEILQDFLVEAGEILEQLSEQLVDLERAPDDVELLNAIFRGFHTVKGGAGFLQFDAMVDCCHVAENAFDALRKGDISLTTDLMDNVLTALDSVNTMFDEVRAGQALTHADPELIRKLARLASGEQPAPAAEAVVEAVAEPVVQEAVSEAVAEPVAQEPVSETVAIEPTSGDSNATGDVISDAEFESLLDALQSEKKDAPPSASPIPVDATPEVVAAVDAAVAPEPESVPVAATDDLFDIDVSTGSGADADEITEDEFEALLNQLSTEPKAPAEAAASPPAEASPIAEASPTAEAPPPVAPPAAAENVAAAPVVVATPAPAAPVVAATPAVPAPEVKVKPAGPASAADKPRTALKESAGEATVRVDTKRLDDIMNMVGELVLVRNRLVRLGIHSQDEDMNKAVSNLDVVTADLQTSVMKTRMQPIKKVFGRFPRVVRDLARNLDKEINLELMGEETDLDKNLVEALADPLVHLVRNSVDHGIEKPSEREAAGKPRNGTIILSAEQEGDHILLTIQDDGKGMDPEGIKDTAVRKGAIDRDSADRLSDSEAFNLIFAPGFSTKETVSDVSGRGVGMDVVKTKIGQLNGTVDIESKMGEGSRIIIKVPLTLAIMPTLMVMLGNQTFALPLVSVNEIFHLNLNDTNVVDGQEVIIVRDKALPLYYLSRWLVSREKKAANDNPESHVVIVSVGSQKIGFVVDQLIGQEEVVIKPLGKMLQGTDGMAGATITGDGTIALILDVPSMLKRYG